MMVAIAIMMEAMRAAENQRKETSNEPEIVLFDFAEDTQPWRTIDDGVMGGVSKGSWRVESGIAVFSGVLSLENNGGFSSVRSQPLAQEHDDVQSLRVRVRGDGRRYQFRVRTSNAFDGPSYRHHFDTVENEWVIVDLPLADFEASFRGRVLSGQPALTGRDMVTLGFLLADKKPGPFRLEVDWIGATQAQESDDTDGKSGP